jgi:hypothetical protein
MENLFLVYVDFGYCFTGGNTYGRLESFYKDRRVGFRNPWEVLVAEYYSAFCVVGIGAEDYND